MILPFLLLTLCDVVVSKKPEQMCTAVALGRLATYDGSTMSLNTIDCSQCDWRLAKVEGKDHSPTDRYPIYPFRTEYPRFVGYSRGDLFTPENLEKGFVEWNVSSPVETIPEVPHSYGYYDGQYPFANEHQLFIAESTCQARLMAKPIYDGGKALFNIGELIRLALARTKTAREAIILMGSLATDRGFYGAEYNLAEGGESLTITDPNEAWVFNILTDDTGASAVWAAQRVPDDHVAVVPNLFSIRQIKWGHPDFLYSSNLIEVAHRAGFWNGTDETEFDFTLAFALPNSIQNPFDDKRRWRWYDVLAPSLHLSPYRDQYDYPFSVKVDKKVDLSTLFSLMRDHFEDTPFDMTKGVLAGPWGNPWYQGLPRGYITNGNLPRPTSLRRTSFSWISQSRNWLDDPMGGRVWYGQHEPASCVYIPLYPAISDVHPAWSTGSLYGYTPKSAWWTFAAIAGWADRFYSLMMPDIRAVQSELEQDAFTKLDEVEEQAVSLLTKETRDEPKAYALLNRFTFLHADRSFHAYSTLFRNLITFYRDGYRLNATDLHKDHITPVYIRYTEEYLKLINYTAIPDYRKPPVSGTNAAVVLGGNLEQGMVGLTMFQLMIIVLSAMILGGLITKGVEAMSRGKGLRAGYERIY